MGSGLLGVTWVLGVGISLHAWLVCCCCVFVLCTVPTRMRFEVTRNYSSNDPSTRPQTSFLSTNLENHGREIKEEESWRRNHGAGFLGGIWEAYGMHLGWDEMR